MDKKTEEALKRMMLAQYDSGAKDVCDSIISVLSDDVFKNKIFNRDEVIVFIESAKSTIQSHGG